MSAKQNRKADDTVSYLIRDIPGEAWRKLKIRAIIEQRSIREALASLIDEYGAGEPTPVKQPARKGKK